MTRLPEEYLCSSKVDCELCAYSDKRKPVILMKVNWSATTVSTESIGNFFARLSSAVNISRVMGLLCLAMISSLSLARMILEHIFARSDKSVGMSK